MFDTLGGRSAESITGPGPSASSTSAPSSTRPSMALHFLPLSLIPRISETLASIPGF
jgi:hypothetical protein